MLETSISDIWIFVTLLLGEGENERNIWKSENNFNSEFMIIIKARPRHWTGYMYLLVYLFVVYLFKEKGGFTTETFPAPNVRSTEVEKAWLSASGLTGHAEVSAERETSARLLPVLTTDNPGRSLQPPPRLLGEQGFSVRGCESFLPFPSHATLGTILRVTGLGCVYLLFMENHLALEGTSQGCHCQKWVPNSSGRSW